MELHAISKSPQEICTISDCRDLLTARRFSSFTMLGFTYFPSGTLNMPRLFTRYRPLKQVRLRKMRRDAFSTPPSGTELRTP